MPRSQVAVVGCGTGGPAAALLLAAQGHDVTLFERVAQPGPVGAGLLLQPTGMHVLQHVGAHGPVLDRAAPLARVSGTTRTGRKVLDLAYPPVAIGTPVMGIHRGLLFSVLFEAVCRSPVRVETGVEIGGVELLGDTRARLRRPDGGSLGEFDLVVVANGARSTLRESLDVPRRVRRSRWGALWSVVEDRDGRFQGELRQVFQGSKQFVGFLPLGRGPGDADGPPLVSLFWSLPDAQSGTWAARGLDAWRDEVLALAPEGEPLLAQIQAPEQMIYAGYTDVQLRHLHHGPVVFIGDAAHAMSPQLGQGANLALFDALVLAEEIGAGGLGPATLDRFDRRRRGHLRYYQRASRLLTPLFQSAIPGLAPLRDAFMYPVSRLPFFRGWMLESMVGIRTGPFSRLPHPPLQPLPAPTAPAQLPPGRDLTN